MGIGELMDKRIIRLGGVRIPCLEVSGKDAPVLVRHEYAGHDGADIEFQGMGPETFTVRAFFPESAIADWNRLKSQIKAGSRVVLEHFEDGEIECRIESVSRRHDKRHGIEVDIDLVADGIDPAPRIMRQSAQDVVAGKAQAMADQAVEQAKKSTLAQIMEAMGRVDALIAAYTSQTSAAFNVLAFGADLPSQLAQRVATVLDLMQGNVPGAPDPATSAAKFLRDVAALAGSIKLGDGIRGAIQILGAYQSASTVAALMATDEDRLQLMQAYESAQAFDERGRWVGGSTLPKQRPASSDQVASLVASVRTQLQSVRPLVADGSLVDLIAAALQDQFNDRLYELERVREIVVPTPTPLHLICHRNGLPYNAAERVLLINPQIRNPTFTQGRIKIYAP